MPEGRGPPRLAVMNRPKDSDEELGRTDDPRPSTGFTNITDDELAARLTQWRDERNEGVGEDDDATYRSHSAVLGEAASRIAGHAQFIRDDLAATELLPMAWLWTHPQEALEQLVHDGFLEEIGQTGCVRITGCIDGVHPWAVVIGAHAGELLAEHPSSPLYRVAAQRPAADPTSGDTSETGADSP
jgi:hypothetical protein